MSRAKGVRLPRKPSPDKGPEQPKPEAGKTLTREEEIALLTAYWRFAPVDRPAGPAAAEPHCVQVRKAFGGDPAHPAAPARVVSVEGSRVTVESLGAESSEEGAATIRRPGTERKT